MSTRVRILAVSGSLRTASSNSAIVAAAVRLSSDAVDVHAFPHLADLPPFNPDLELQVTPPAVSLWREALRESAAVLISSPEYAHGVPGVLKNALDWVVGSGEFMHKPVALVNSSAHSTYVTAQLRETITVMMGEVRVATSLSLSGRPASADDVLAQPAAQNELRDVLEQLARQPAPSES